MNNALLSSKKMDWCTPQDFFNELNEEFGFVLDPAATEKTAKCPLYYTPETDGLSQSWNRGGAGWGDENEPRGETVELCEIGAYEECPICRTMLPEKDYCPHCGESLRTERG